MLVQAAPRSPGAACGFLLRKAAGNNRRCMGWRLANGLGAGRPEAGLSRYTLAYQSEKRMS